VQPDIPDVQPARVQAKIRSLNQSKARLARARDPRPDAAVADARHLHLDAADLCEQRLAADVRPAPGQG
jgi:hypothetical protein